MSSDVLGRFFDGAAWCVKPGNSSESGVAHEQVQPASPRLALHGILAAVVGKGGEAVVRAGGQSASSTLHRGLHPLAHQRTGGGVTSAIVHCDCAGERVDVCEPRHLPFGRSTSGRGPPGRRKPDVVQARSMHLIDDGTVFQRPSVLCWRSRPSRLSWGRDSSLGALAGTGTVHVVAPRCERMRVGTLAHPRWLTRLQHFDLLCLDGKQLAPSG